MVELNFSQTDSGPADYVTVPAGSYVCRIQELREGATRNGDVRWSLRLHVDEGEYLGRLAAWDSLVLSPKGLNRARKVLAALGLPHQGKVEIDPKDLEDRKAIVEIRPAEYVNPSGEVIRRNEVPYDGYRAIEDARNGENGSDPEVDMPF